MGLSDIRGPELDPNAIWTIDLAVLSPAMQVVK